MSQLHQMHLEVKLDDQATFDNFYAPKGSSQQLAKFLLQESVQQFVCLVGNSGSVKRIKESNRRREPNKGRCSC